MAKNPETDGNTNVQVAVLSEKGRRQENQDWMSWSQIPWGECYIVADGMGGYKGGALAARMTVEGLESQLKAQSSDRPFEQALQEAVSVTNEQVYRAATSGNPDTDHMGSTLAVALISRNQLLVGHVGDSRIYLVRRGRLKLLTTDHTNVQRMVDAGMITEEQARTHPDANILSRAIGSKPEVEIEIGKPIPLEAGDGILLCSDGLSGYVEDQQIEKVVGKASDVQKIPKQLVDLALESGGDDNVTVQFVRYGKASGRHRRHTAPQGRLDQRLFGDKSRWIAVALVAVVAGAGLAYGVKRVVRWWSAPPQTASGGVSSTGSTSSGNPAPPTGNSASTSTPIQPDVAKKTNATRTQSRSASTPSSQPSSTGGTQGGTPTAGGAAGAASSSAGPPQAAPATHEQTAAAPANATPVPVLIFLRDSNEMPLAQKIEQSPSIQPSAVELPTRSDTDLDSPPLTQCFIFYPDPSLENAAKQLKAKLDKIPLGNGLCADHWHFNTYKEGVRTSFQNYVQGQAAQQYLLIAFPKKN